MYSYGVINFIVSLDYLCRRLASEGIVLLGLTLSRCVCVRRAAYITYRLDAALVSVAKVMRCIQCSLVHYFFSINVNNNVN